MSGGVVRLLQSDALEANPLRRTRGCEAAAEQTRGERETHLKTIRAGIGDFAAAAEHQGKVAAFMASDDDWARRFRGYGYSMFAYSMDILLYQRALASGIQTLRAQS